MIENATMEALADSRGRPMVCRWCRTKAEVNRKLRITFCPVHGFESPLDPADLPAVRVERVEFSRAAPYAVGGGSWAIPAE
jgi:hypothetical protein